MRRLVLLALIVPLAALAKSSGGHGGSGHGATHAANNPQSSGGSKPGSTSSHGGGIQNRMDPRHAPPLASDRKVHEQDCTQPVDWSAGNLKCK